jgi:hypothetical protein
MFLDGFLRNPGDDNEIDMVSPEKLLRIKVLIM